MPLLAASIVCCRSTYMSPVVRPVRKRFSTAYSWRWGSARHVLPKPWQTARPEGCRDQCWNIASVNESRVSGQPTEDMPHSASVSKSQTAPVDPSPRKRAAQDLAKIMRTGSCPNDRSFDRFLPKPLRLVASEYWTPLAVARRAAEWLEGFGIQNVVDIGSGAGKFCVAGALFGKCQFIGLERYSSRVTSARALADLFDVNHRVSFVAGSLGAVPTPVGDAYYFFNPFGEYWLGADHPLEAGAEVTEPRHPDGVAAAEDLLRRAPVGT